MLVLPTGVRERISAHAREGYPHEVCGLLLGKMHGVAPGDRREVATSMRARNLNSERPHDRYLMDPKDVNAADQTAREQGLEIVGFYHSHPDHPARPSQYDLDHAWPTFAYVIVAVAAGAAAEMTVWYLKEDRTTFEKGELHGDENSDSNTAAAVHR